MPNCQCTHGQTDWYWEVGMATGIRKTLPSFRIGVAIRVCHYYRFPMQQITLNECIGLLSTVEDSTASYFTSS
jgi:hypothetical protein